MGGSGNGTIYGEGDDKLIGGLGDDTLMGDAAAGTTVGGDGNDLIFAGAGDDLLMTSIGDDTIFSLGFFVVFLIVRHSAATMCHNPPLSKSPYLDP